MPFPSTNVRHVVVREDLRIDLLERGEGERGDEDEGDDEVSNGHAYTCRCRTHT